jgi:hypothetical protein
MQLLTLFPFSQLLLKTDVRPLDGLRDSDHAVSISLRIIKPIDNSVTQIKPGALAANVLMAQYTYFK